MTDDEFGFDYEPGLQIVPALGENQGGTDWRYEALCHEQYDVFDLHTENNHTQTIEQKIENRYRIRAARRICFECPVFQQCHEDALERLPISVVQAGARLSSPFAKQRERALLRAHIAWQHHKFRKKRKRLEQHG